MENKNCLQKNEHPTREGWVDDISSHGLRHYFKDGFSLCGRAKEKHFFRHFDKETIGSEFACDCKLCIKKLKKLREKKIEIP